MERAFEAAARLDAHRAQGPGKPMRRDWAERLRFEARLRTLDAWIDREIDRLTVDLLRAQLTRKRFLDHGDLPSLPIPEIAEIAPIAELPDAC